MIYVVRQRPHCENAPCKVGDRVATKSVPRREGVITLTMRVGAKNRYWIRYRRDGVVADEGPGL